MSDVIAEMDARARAVVVTREWRAANPERAREQGRRYYAKRREHVLARISAFRKEHPEKERARYAKNPARHQVFVRAWAIAHPEERKAAKVRRRALLAAAEGSFTNQEWLALLERFDGCCAYCGVRTRMSVDHRTPISRGGSNDLENILPACQSCNSRKGAKTESEFRAWLMTA